MWEASLGIIIFLAVMFSIAILSSVGSAKHPARSREELAAATAATTINSEPDSKQLDAARQQAVKGASRNHPPFETPATPAEMAARGHEA